MKLWTHKGIMPEEELQAAEKCFTIELHLGGALQGPDKIVLPRYTMLPFYRENERTLNDFGKRPFNTYEQHLAAASVLEWYPLLSDVTPRTWATLAEAPDIPLVGELEEAAVGYPHVRSEQAGGHSGDATPIRRRVPAGSDHHLPRVRSAEDLHDRA